MPEKHKGKSAEEIIEWWKDVSANPEAAEFRKETDIRGGTIVVKEKKDSGEIVIIPVEEKSPKTNK